LALAVTAELLVLEPHPTVLIPYLALLLQLVAVAVQI
jgi:hypothetical protein